MTVEERRKYRKALVGVVTSNGTVIKGVSRHAFVRAGERKISPSKVADTLAVEATLSEQRDNCDVYVNESDGCRIIVDRDAGAIVSIMWREKRS